MTTKKKQTNKLLKDMGAVITPVFYIFGFVAIVSAIIVCGFQWTTVIMALFLLLLAAAGASDVNKGIVPDLIPIAIAVLAIIKFTISGITLSGLISCLLGAVCLSIPMLIVALLIKGGFGGGDIKLIAASGLFLGLDKTLIAGFIAFLLAGIYGIVLLLTKNKGPKAKIRFAPYLAIGCAFSGLFGDVLILIFKSFLR